MAYFPFFIDLAQANGLVIGGGPVALRKVEKLLPYGPQLTVAAPQLCPALEQYIGITLLRRPFLPSDLDGRTFVVAAGSRQVNLQAAQLCRERGIPINVVDNKSESTFLFPALLKQGELSVGISTSGSSPSAAVWLRDRLADSLPPNFDAILDFLAAQRPAAQAELSHPQQREKLMALLFQRCLVNQGPLTTEETEQLFQLAREGQL